MAASEGAGVAAGGQRRRRETAAAAATAYRAALEAPYLAYAAQHGKPGWGDKTPYYVGHIDELRRVFPEARIVNLVRDGRDVALSLLRVPFGPANVWAAAHQWRDAVDAGERAAERLGADLLTVRYEDLVAGPETAIPAVCEFLEIGYRPEMLAVEESPPELIAAGQEAWFRELYGGISAGSVGKWRRQMSRSDIALFESIAGAELERHGYQTGLGSTPPHVPAAAYLAHNWSVKLWHFTAAARVARAGTRGALPGAAEAGSLGRCGSRPPCPRWPGRRGAGSRSARSPSPGSPAGSSAAPAAGGNGRRWRSTAPPSPARPAAPPAPPHTTQPWVASSALVTSSTMCSGPLQ